MRIRWTAAALQSISDYFNVLLRAENDYDSQGLALMDEFSDAISACTAADFGYSIRLVSVVTV